MSKASQQADSRGETWVERRQHWIAVSLSALLHVLLLLLMMLSPPIKVTTPQGTDGGSRMAVDFIGEETDQPTPTPPTKKPPSKPAKKAPAKSRVQSTLVTHADDPLPPDEPDDAAQNQPQAPAASPPPSLQRRSRTWGQPPGLLPQGAAAENSGLSRSPDIGRGRGNESSGGQPSMEVGGYQVYYDLVSEIRLRAWRDKGMTEIFLPLPGTQRYMICPLETALRRESGPCRLLEPDAPELKTIGDAREVISMQKVYRQGELVWSGPGAYR